MTRLLVFLTLAASALAQNKLTREEKAAGWILLFDGKTMADWSKAAPDAWTIEDGCLKSIARPALREDLLSKRTFGDFELVFE